MAASDRLALHIVGPLAPDIEGRSVAAAEAAPAPEHQNRDRDFLACGLVGLVGGAVERRAGAIILAGRVNARGLVEGGAVMGERTGIEGREILRGGPARQRVIDERKARRRRSASPATARLRQERPVIGFQRLLPR